MTSAGRVCPLPWMVLNITELPLYISIAKKMTGRVREAASSPMGSSKKGEASMAG